MAETLASVRTAVSKHLGDSTQTIWTAAEIDQYTRQGYDEFARATLAIWDWDYLNDVAGTATYTLPDSLLVIDRVAWDLLRIPPIAPRRMRLHNSQYQTTQGQPGGYIVDADGITEIRLVPVPSSSATSGQDTNNTRIEGYWRGSDLNVDLDEFDVPERYVKYIRFFDLWKALERKGPGQDLALADHYKGRFAEGMKRIVRRRENIGRERVGRMGGTRVNRRSGIPAPQLPWNFGREVRWR